MSSLKKAKHDRLLRVIKLFSLFIITFTRICFASNSYSQQAVFTFESKNQTVETVIHQVEKNSEFIFFYLNDVLDLNRRVNIRVSNQTIENVLEQLFKGTDNIYKISDRQISVFKREKTGNTVSNQVKQRSITGIVVDQRGEVVIGANVVIKGTTNGCITNLDGHFMLENIPGSATLQITYIGFQSQEIKIGSRDHYNIILKDDSQVLDEIVVVSFGTQKKRTLTGAVSSLKAEGSRDMPVSQFAQGMQGKISGVQIYQTNGRPGEGMSFRIRGAGSLNSGNTPLFVVDGMPIATEISNISPDEIESFSVLKDASASALYGSRAANGVVLITTKRAKEGKTTVEFSANVGIQTIPMERMPDLMNGTEYAQFKKNYYEDMIRYTGWTNPANGKAEIPIEYQNPEKYGEGTDWFGKIMRNAPIQNYSVSVNSGNDKLRATVVASYTNQQGVLKNTGYERFNFRVNTEYHLSKAIRFGANLAPSFRVQNNHSTDGSWNIIGAALYAPPILPFQNENGSYPELLQAFGSLPQPHPYVMLTKRVNTYKGTRLLGNAFAEFDIWKGLTWKSTINIDMESSNHRIYTPKEAAGGINSIGTKSSGSYQSGFATSWLTEHTLSYNGKFGDHSLDALGGFTAQKYRWEGAGVSGENYSNDYPWLNQAQTTKLKDAEWGVDKNTPTAWAVASFLARINYNYKEKYLLQAALREDGCSRFGAENRWGLFPSISAGWIMSEESFMSRLNPVVNYLKVRGSYGITGNNNIGDYTYLANISNSNYIYNGQINGGTYLSSLENNQLGWEKTKQLDFGVDLGFLNDRIYFQADYWNKLTSDMLYDLTLPLSSGYGSIWSNTGEVKFWGFDFDLETKNLTGSFKWSTNLNLSFGKNKVMSLGPNTDHLGGDVDYGGGWNRTEVGKPLGFLYGYVYDGVFMNAQELEKGPKYADSDANRASMVGSPRMKDISGPNGAPDGIITREDRTMIGDPNPDFMFGMTNNFEYKNFDFSFLISGSIGGDLVMCSKEFSSNLDGAFNMDRALLNCWRSEENPGDGVIARAAGPSGTTWLARDRSTFMVFDGSYATLKNITLGYTVPIRQYIKKARIYVSIQNACILTKYPGTNPESSINGANARSAGLDDSSYPVPRTFSMGVNVTF